MSSSATVTSPQAWLRAFRLPWRFALPALLVAAVLAAFPQIDMAVSGAVYDASRGGFYLSHHWMMDVLDILTSIASGLVVMGCVGWWLVVQRRWPVKWRVGDRMAMYLFLVFVIGPILIVSLGFKEHWGRPRPEAVVEFAGSQQFVPYYSPTGACAGDCSFPSGHTSRGFFFITFAVAAYGLGWAYRRPILFAALGFGVLSAVLRILEGKHFLSDVTLSGMIVSYVAWVVFRIVYRHKPHRFAD